jgi:exonuclease SbcD
MKIIHTADLHLGQIIYQNYDRVDEHEHFFKQLENLCRQEKPDALVVSGDIFDIQQPSASTRKSFTDHFVSLHNCYPAMTIVITAGNHDSASRIQADRAIWELGNVRLIGISPSPELLGGPDGWQEDYIVKLLSGYIVTLPYMPGERTAVIQSILDKVALDNTEAKPVVMTGHLAITGMDPCGHDIEIGKIKTQDIASMGSGYDYLALGHIHKPQTIGHQEDAMKDDVTYPSGTVRYSGSALHVSCDEKYPHTLSIVEIDKRGGDVHIRQKRINELRHFYELPLDGGSFTSPEDAISALESFAKKTGSGYFRLRFDYKTALPANFTNTVYDILKAYGEEIRFNPKHIWTGRQEELEGEKPKLTFEVADLQQMTDPMTFIEKTKDQYPDLDLEEVRQAFEEVKEELARMQEAEKDKAAKKAAGKAAKPVAEESSTESE